MPPQDPVKVSNTGVLARLMSALAASENRAYQDAVGILDAILPDNSNFTADDATDWERRLGIISGDGVSLTDRKLAIAQKMAHPGDIPARQHHEYLEGQLQAAGFDVYVYENVFPSGGGFEPISPYVAIGGTGQEDLQHGQVNHGQAQHGGRYTNIIANYISEEQDSLFYIPSNLKGTFFIGGDPFGSFADVDTERKAEFRQLILRLKPVHMVGYLFINYV